MSHNNASLKTISLVIGAFVLSACQSETQPETQPEKPASNMSFSAPARIIQSRAVDKSQLRPSVRLSDDTIVPMQPAGENSWSGTVDVRPNTSYSITVEWNGTLPDGAELSLATWTGNVDVDADGTEHTFSEREYIYTDQDGDGASNLLELENNTDPLVFDERMAIAGESDTGGTDSTDGTTTTGGTNTTTGTTATGGTDTTAGTTATGGTDTTAGTTATGGTDTTDGTTATGGTDTTDGTTTTGGTDSTDGTTTTGGTDSTDGTTTTGGTDSTDGTTTTGGTDSTDGTTTTGGTDSTDGTTTTGGTDSTDGTTTDGSDSTAGDTAGTTDDGDTDSGTTDGGNNGTTTRASVLIPRIRPNDAPDIDGEDVTLNRRGALTGEWADAVQTDLSGEGLWIDRLMILNFFNEDDAEDGDKLHRWAAMHDGEYLYVLVLSDDVGQRNSDSEKIWQDDSIELFIDGDNSKSSEWDDDDFHYQIALLQLDSVQANDEGAGRIAAGPNTTSTPFDFAFATGPGIGPDGIREARYEQDVYEIAIPIADAGITLGEPFGFDVQLDDDDNGDARDAKWGWNHPSRSNDINVDLTFQDPSVMGIVTLEE